MDDRFEREEQTLLQSRRGQHLRRSFDENVEMPQIDAV
jgi:hypothetical protein